MVKFTERVKEHVKKHKELYLGIGVGIGLAGITCLIMKDKNLRAVLLQGADGQDAVTTGFMVSSPHISPELLGTTSPELLGTGESAVSIFSPHLAINNSPNTVLNLKQVINSNRKGAPSWVVRCVETGQIYTSQRAAALATGIAESDISRHLNGLRELSENLHFERICLAA